ncbi:MAG: hypothetical protein EOO92_20730, partial [Pedobacter sp.]
MYKKYLLLLLMLVPVFGICQEEKSGTKSEQIRSQNQDSVRTARPLRKDAQKVAADTIATIDMYKIITLDRDTTFVDTSLTIQKDYRANYLRKDNFGLLPFSNEGQTYNILDYSLVKFNPFPEFGFKAKHFAYMEVDDINYYNVATPFTDLFYRSVIQQGQIMDAFITVNTSENLNFAVGYKGLRSLGKYINQLSSNGNFRFITSYNTTNKRYQLKLHFAAQDFSNQENGGITDTSQFESGEEPYTQRERLDVYFRDATSLLKGNRYFVDHTFRLSKDNPNSIVIHHQFNYENKFFEFSQPTVSDRFGDAYTSSINNKTRYNKMYNKVGAAYSNKTVGDLEFYVEDFNYNYYYKSIILDNDGSIAVPNSLNDRINTYGARYSYQKGKWKGSVFFSNSITNQSLANIEASARYIFDDLNQVSFRYQNMNKLPDLNYRLYQSDYVNYNWSRDFNNEKTNNIEVEAQTQWVTASAQYSILNDHLYFKDTNTSFVEGEVTPLLVKPFQNATTINYLSLKLSKEFRYGKFALDNT